jgi:hypothetical protein
MPPFLNGFFAKRLDVNGCSPAAVAIESLPRIVIPGFQVAGLQIVGGAPKMQKIGWLI